MNVLILEPYFTGSHKAWAEGVQKYSAHQVEILGMPGNFWKWRMHGGAVTLARKFLRDDFQPDLLLSTDMLDLTTFLALTRRKTSNLPATIYFHENQLTYPWSEKDRDVQKKRDRHYGFINFASALAADSVAFNSKYHRDSFLTELPRFLRHFPDEREMDGVEKIKRKSTVLPLGLDLDRFDRFRNGSRQRLTNCRPLILWNHRWEYDKNPSEFFEALFVLAGKGLEFEVAILGECFAERPEEFTGGREKLGDRVVHYGFVRDFSEYASWLWRSDILPVTSNQDFFGASVVEALYCNCFPILPRRLAYPEMIPIELHDRHFYKNFQDLVERLEVAILSRDTLRKKSLRSSVQRFSWSAQTAAYDTYLDSVFAGETS